MKLVQNLSKIATTAKVEFERTVRTDAATDTVIDLELATGSGFAAVVCSYCLHGWQTGGYRYCGKLKFYECYLYKDSTCVWLRSRAGADGPE